MTATAPNQIHLTLPGEWIEIDPREPDVLGALLQAAAVPQESAQVASALLAPLAVRLSRLSAAADLVLAGFYSELIPLEGSEDPFLVSANVTLALSPPIGDLAQLRELLGGDDVEVAPVELPAGSAVLVSGTTQVDDEGWDGPQPARLRRYFVPVPGMSRVAALSFLTPNLDLADQFDEVFDAIAATLSFS
ncbi:MAG TPA: hypothetical protein VD903_16875 [Pseudonocardia sp.]|nr:hypothetical protein [Pseudonocardia sp.]